MKKTRNTTVCGMLSALSVVIMLTTAVLPALMYVMPMVAGFIVYLIDRIIGLKWSIGVFLVTSLVSLIIITDKEVGLNYFFIFGFYPLIKERLERFKKPVSRFLKLISFNLLLVLLGLTVTFVFGIPFLDEDFGKLTIPIFALLFNVVFVMFDFLFSLLIIRFKPILDRLKSKLS